MLFRRVQRLYRESQGNGEKNSSIKEKWTVVRDVLPRDHALRLGLNFSENQAEEFLASLKSGMKG